MQSPYLSKGGDPKTIGAEIDVFEYIKSDPEKIYHTVHYGGYEKEQHKKSGGTVNVDNIKISLCGLSVIESINHFLLLCFSCCYNILFLIL